MKHLEEMENSEIKKYAEINLNKETDDKCRLLTEEEIGKCSDEDIDRTTIVRGSTDHKVKGKIFSTVKQILSEYDDWYIGRTSSLIGRWCGEINKETGKPYEAGHFWEGYKRMYALYMSSDKGKIQYYETELIKEFGSENNSTEDCNHSPGRWGTQPHYVYIVVKKKKAT